MQCVRSFNAKDARTKASDPETMSMH